MVVVSVVALLGALAYPSYVGQVRKARRSDIQGELMGVAQFMERLYSETGCYNPGGDNDCADADDQAAPSLGISNDYYTVSFQGTVTADTFKIRATPKSTGPQAGDGYLEIDQLGRRYWDQNNNGNTGDSGESDWFQG